MGNPYRPLKWLEDPGMCYVIFIFIVSLNSCAMLKHVFFSGQEKPNYSIEYDFSPLFTTASSIAQPVNMFVQNRC